MALVMMFIPLLNLLFGLLLLFSPPKNDPNQNSNQYGRDPRSGVGPQKRDKEWDPTAIYGERPKSKETLNSEEKPKSEALARKLSGQIFRN